MSNFTVRHIFIIKIINIIAMDCTGSKLIETPCHRIAYAGNTKGGSITVPLTSCFTGLESAV